MQLRNFKYTAINADGKTIKGKMEALSKSVCVKYLQAKNYKVKSIVEYKNIITYLEQITIGRLIKPKQLVFFLKQLGSLLNSGVKLLPALELLSLQQENKNIRKLYFELYQQVYNGNLLSNGMARRPKEFPNLLIQMVKVGELSGELPETILKMATYYESQMKLSSEIKGATRMPLIYLGAAIVISIGMLLFVFPNITGLFAAFEGAELPGITQFFIDTGDFFQAYAIFIFAVAAIIAGLFYFLNKYNKKFHYVVKLGLLKLPVFGSLIQMTNQILIANSLSQMLSNGIHSMQALETTRDILEHDVYKELITKTLNYLQDGKPFSKAFEESPHIDPIMAKMIATGEKTGDIPKLMANLSEYYNGISEIRIQQIKNSLQPILLILVYAIVGVMILAIMLPMLSLGTQI
ncbi:type II secretion system F family protein [Mariniplasma anaerobium]|uniref:Type II secretion system protein n=1 Tax=Mariniplasma anaerobium TaxID=2735436 RepID=A0A7U9TI17_9MOLU|nr:type II secretion system F family protein [Mariniplasma anaerobium]BCR35580.1 type II secretion system protein [Mariniplasma anaerobium]